MAQLNDPTMTLGDSLRQQVGQETEDERKRRMLQMQQQQSLGLAGSLALSTALAPGGGRSAGY